MSASESDTADGEEYQRTLDDQGEAETYLQAYAALLADRREAMYNERTILAAHDARLVSACRSSSASDVSILERRNFAIQGLQLKRRQR